MTDPDQLSDADLVRACRAGEQAAWAALVRRFQRILYTVPRRAGLSEAQAADVFQFTFTRFYEQLDTLDQPERVQAWLVTTARRETLRLLSEAQRFTQPRTQVDAEGEREHDPIAALVDDAPLPPERLERWQASDRVRRAMRQLDPRSRMLLEMLFLHDEPVPYQEIARRLHISEGSIGPTRQRSLEKLRAILDAMP